MGQKETNLKNKIDADLSIWQRLWRINSGQGWAGRIIDKKNGILKLINFRPFKGASAGFPDQVGFDSIEIKSEMVGIRVAIFVGCELKATKNDKLKKSQLNFKNLLIKMGGIHREVREDGMIIESSPVQGLSSS